MFRIYNDAIRFVQLMQPLIEKIRRSNRNLAKQLDEARVSVPLNLAEGAHRRGGHQRERFETAIGSARESIAGLHVAIACNYIAMSECDAALDCADKIAATLWRCLHGRNAR